MFTRFYNVLNENEVDKCLKILSTSSWHYGGNSNSGTTVSSYNRKFWYMELTNFHFFSVTLFNKIKALTGKDLTIDRLYANGQTHGLSGNMHVDDSRSNSWTFLYYANKEWNALWGGSTVFLNGGDSVTADFIPNTAILFKGNLLHAGLEPTSHFEGLRMTVAYKLLEV